MNAATVGMIILGLVALMVLGHSMSTKGDNDVEK